MRLIKTHLNHNPMCLKYHGTVQRGVDLLKQYVAITSIIKPLLELSNRYLTTRTYVVQSFRPLGVHFSICLGEVTFTCTKHLQLKAFTRLESIFQPTQIGLLESLMGFILSIVFSSNFFFTLFSPVEFFHMFSPSLFI